MEGVSIWRKEWFLLVDIVWGRRAGVQAEFWGRFEKGPLIGRLRDVAYKKKADLGSIPCAEYGGAGIFGVLCMGVEILGYCWVCVGTGIPVGRFQSQRGAVSPARPLERNWQTEDGGWREGGVKGR